jgi:hypothetical protein
MTTDDETEAANQMEAAVEAIREAVLRLLEAGEVDPQYVVLAAAQVTGELGADIARIGDVDLEMVLGDLADLVREAGRAHAEGPPWPGAPRSPSTDASKAGGVAGR